MRYCPHSRSIILFTLPFRQGNRKGEKEERRRGGKSPNCFCFAPEADRGGRKKKKGKEKGGKRRRKKKHSEYFLENVYRTRKKGEEKKEAALWGGGKGEKKGRR